MTIPNFLSGVISAIARTDDWYEEKSGRNRNTKKVTRKDKRKRKRHMEKKSRKQNRNA